MTFSDGEAAKKALKADENDLYLDYRYVHTYTIRFFVHENF